MHAALGAVGLEPLGRLGHLEDLAHLGRLVPLGRSPPHGG
jgi:hypothetical protein